MAFEKLAWTAVAVGGGVSFAVVALTRGEPVNAAWLVVASVCIYFIAYRFYALFIVNRVLGVDPKRVTPAYRHNDGLDYVPDQPLRPVRPSFRRHRRGGPAGRAGARGADGLSAGHALDPRGRCLRRRGAGHDGAVPVHPAGRQVARRDDPHGDRSCGRKRRRRRDPPDLHHSAGCAGAGCGQCAEGQPVGRLRGVLHHPHRADHGPLQPLHPTRPDRRDVAHRRGAAAGGAHLRKDGFGDARAGGLVHSERADAGVDRHRLWLLGVGPARVAAACAARLSVDLPQGRNHFSARDRHRDRAARSRDAGGDQVRRRLRARLGGQPVPVPVHHHRLRVGVRLALAHLLGDLAEDDREREPDPLHRLRRRC